MIAAPGVFVELPARVRDWLTPGFTPTPDLKVWEWAAQDVDFSRVPNYDTPIHGPYDPDYMPYWKEPVEAVFDPDVDEVIILKCTRAGASENVILNAIRYTVAVRPQPTMYVTGDQLAAKLFMEKRIVRGLRASKTARQQLTRANLREYDIEFPMMDLRATWPKNKMAFKQDGWALVLVDEASLLPPGTDDMARKRTASYPFGTVVFSSSPDPQAKRASRSDPIFINYKRGDRRKWFIRYGKRGKWFTMILGTKSPHGLRWSEKCRKKDGSWDYDGVTETAYYLTPEGKKIREKDRLEVVNQGKWRPTESAHSKVRSYHCNAFMTPFDSFGSIAVSFLKAQSEGPLSLKTFIFEQLAEEWDPKAQSFDEQLLHRRMMEYKRGATPFGDEKGVLRLMTVDQQKDHFWYAVRDWRTGGESALVDWGRVISYDDIDTIAEDLRPAFIGIDSGYGQRTNEVYIESLERNYVPMKGDDKAKPGLSLWTVTPINPYEGTRRQSDEDSVDLVVFHSDSAQLMLADRVKGRRHGWSVCRGIDKDYVDHMTSAKRQADGWHYDGDNHIWDCETMQIILAARYGYIQTASGDEDAAPED